MPLSSYDLIVADIVSGCTDHHDVCCLVNEDTFTKVLTWVENFGATRTFELIKLQCACAPRPPPPEVSDKPTGLPIPPPPHGDTPPPPVPVPPPPSDTCDLPPQGTATEST